MTIEEIRRLDDEIPVKGICRACGQYTPAEGGKKAICFDCLRIKALLEKAPKKALAYFVPIMMKRINE